MKISRNALIAGYCMAAFCATTAQAGWWGDKTNPSKDEGYSRNKTMWNSNRNEDLSTRDYTRTRAPYPVGAPPVYNDYEEDHASADRHGNQMAGTARTSTDYRNSANKDVRSYNMNTPADAQSSNRNAATYGNTSPAAGSSNYNSGTTNR